MQVEYALSIGKGVGGFPVISFLIHVKEINHLTRAYFQMVLYHLNKTKYEPYCWKEVPKEQRNLIFITNSNTLKIQERVLYKIWFDTIYASLHDSYNRF